VTRHTKAREEISAGGIVFRRDGARTFFLLIRDPYRNWGFPKGHLEEGEAPDAAAVREVAEETGIAAVEVRSAVETIDWTFRFRGRKIHKTCHFFLMETTQRRTAPQAKEGITACRWATYEQATKMIAYENARAVLEQAQAILEGRDLDGGDDAGSIAAGRAIRDALRDALPDEA
jgi:8-oxo-dGTP pyrophosphatase MutT (NUDIX family)